MEKKNFNNPHTKHRERMRQKAINGGLRLFSDHELLEIILFYGIPMKDTNLLAHELLNKYGSLDAVFKADALDLKAFYNMTEIESVNIAVTGEIFRRIAEQKQPAPVFINSTHDAAVAAKRLINGSVKEEVALICLSPDNRIVFMDIIGKGGFSKVNIVPRDIIQIAIRQNSNKVILCHNHPSNNCSPSEADITLTEYLADGFGMCDIELLEHLIITKDDVYSIRLGRVLENTQSLDGFENSSLPDLKRALADSKKNFL